MLEVRRSAAGFGAETRQILLCSLARATRSAAAISALARLASIERSDARALVRRLPAALPHALSHERAAAWCKELSRAGFITELTKPLDLTRCHRHVKHWRSTDCPGCGEPVCTICAARLEASGHCASCDPKHRLSFGRRYYRLRVALLLAVLAAVVVHAGLDYARRSARRAWRRPLEIALVLIREGSVEPELLDRLERRARALEQVLEAEFSRYGGEFAPVRFHHFGPLPLQREPPRAEPGSSPIEALRLSLALSQFARQHDRAAGLDPDAYDGRIYVLSSPPSSDDRALVEGLGEDGGRLAVTNVELSEHSIDFALFVVAHELFHLLGATDRYDAQGRTQIPEGLGEPDLNPRYPQRGTEVMARGRVVSPNEEVPPDTLSELRIGARTAREIGWLAEP